MPGEIILTIAFICNILGQFQRIYWFVLHNIYGYTERGGSSLDVCV